MSDQDEVMRVMEMSETDLLRYIVEFPYYLTDSYYSKIGGAIRNRVAALAKVAAHV